MAATARVPLTSVKTLGSGRSTGYPRAKRVVAESPVAVIVESSNPLQAGIEQAERERRLSLYLRGEEAFTVKELAKLTRSSVAKLYAARGKTLKMTAVGAKWIVSVADAAAYIGAVAK